MAATKTWNCWQACLVLAYVFVGWPTMFHFAGIVGRGHWFLTAVAWAVVQIAITGSPDSRTTAQRVESSSAGSQREQ